LVFSVPPGIGGGGRRRARSWTPLPGSSTRSWRRMRGGRESSGIPRSGSLSGFVTSTATLAGSPSSGTTFGGDVCSSSRCLCSCSTIPVMRDAKGASRPERSRDPGDRKPIQRRGRQWQLKVATKTFHLDDRFSFLTDGRRTALRRHQTLRATLDWSYELLAEPERLLLRRLSIFAGTFTLAAA